MPTEFGYVYILTNPSMHGLVKVGKTTTTPNQRMSELHSTGVPTPFKLEFSISVDDCHKAERLAHKALDKCRVSANREFFRISVKSAIEKILEVVDEFEVVDFRDTHGVTQIEAEVRRRKLLREEEELRRRAEIDRKRRHEEEKNRAQQASLLKKLDELKSRLTALGTRPKEEEPEGWTLLAMCYFPLPIGWLFWMGALSTFGAKSPNAGLICMALIAVGYFASERRSAIDEKNNRLLKPFRELDEGIRSIGHELKNTDWTQAAFSNAQAPLNSRPIDYSANNSTLSSGERSNSKKIISDNSVIRERSEFPRSISEISNTSRNKPQYSITCPTCKHRVEFDEEKIDYKCLSCGGAFRY
jgi:T5orf172 domain